MELDFRITRNTLEIITEEELKVLLRDTAKPTTYCGYEVSGPVHLGTLVAITKQHDFQQAGWKVKVLLADVHTLLNKKGEEEWINEMCSYWENSFKALGLKKAEFIRGSEFQFSESYIKDILNLALHTTLKELCAVCRE